MRTTAHRALMGAAAVALSAVTLADSAPAQAQQVSQATAVLEEIVVTARRREENIQVVPVAITAYSAEEITKRDIRSVTELAYNVPAFNNRVTQRRNQVQSQTMRALPGVQFYFAEVPTSLGGDGLFLDLANVQALVGPQGTLFGLNATGGAILREPKRPTDKFEGWIEGTLGNYNQRVLRGAINVPLVEDKVLVRVAAEKHVRDGFTKVLGRDEKLDDRNSTAARLGVTLKPVDWIESYTVFSHQRADTNALGETMSAVNPAGPVAALYGLARVQAIVAQQLALGPRTSVGITPADSAMKQRNYQIVNNTSLELTDTLTLKNVASRTWQHSADVYDQDGTPLAILESGPVLELPPFTVDWTEELQLQGKFFDGKLVGTIGGFVSYTEIDNPRPLCNGIGITFGALLPCVTTDNKSRTQRLFGQATFDLGALSPALDGLKLTGGYSYNWDYTSNWSKSVSRTNLTTCTVATADANCISARNGKWKAPGWTVALDYQIRPETLLYVTARRAYSSGSFNGVNLPANLQIVKPEFNTDVEFGIKADWELGGARARTNLAFFNNWYDDIKRTQGVVFVDALGVSRFSAVTQNAASATIRGLETQLTVFPIPELEIGFNYQYLMARYNEYNTIDSVTRLTVDLSKSAFTGAPRHKGTVSARVHLPIDEAWGQASFGVNYIFRSQVTVSPDRIPFQITPGNYQLDLRADWTDIGGYPIDLGLFATNVTDTVYETGLIPLYGPFGYHESVWNEPRAYGVTLKYKW